MKTPFPMGLRGYVNEQSGYECQQRVPSPLGLTRVGKFAGNYELRSIDPLSLRERARVRVTYLPLSAPLGEGWGEGETVHPS